MTLPPLCVLLALLTTLSSARATEWQVSGKGDDTQDGKTEQTAFRTLGKAAEVVEPGDTVLVGDGIYTDPDTDSQSAVLAIKRSGKPDAWITWKAVAGAHPELRPVGWNGVMVAASYQILDGLTVTGANDSIRLIDALKQAQNARPDPHYNTNGISIDGRQNPPDQKPHHVIVRNCTVNKMPGGGITMLEGDYITIEDNLVFENCWFMRYGGSGITTNGNWAHDDEPGYHIVIQRNKVWDNKTMVPWGKIGKLSDGNGILLDVTDLRSSGPANPTAEAAAAADAAAKKEAADPAAAHNQRPEWKGRALIANNLSCYNGGSGIHVFRTQYVDIVNNTTYWNGQIVNYEELFSNNSRDVTILNNVIVPAPAGRVTSNNRNTDVKWDYNLYPVKQEVMAGEHDVIADPQFVKVARDLRDADFRLRPGSAARDSGTDDLSQAADLTGAPRPAGAARDRGAYEQ